jgi:hypothetical protein
MTHQGTFAKFVEEINKLQYVFVRGFIKLPQAPDTDVDIISSLKDFYIMVTIASKWMTFMGGDHKDFGFAEWCNMIYAPFHTDGPHNPNIPNGRFRVDIYNSLYFLSPYKNFTTNWTVPKKFNEAVLTKRIRRNDFFIPCPEHEIMLLVCRDVFDKQGQWSDKHMNRIKDLLNSSANRSFLITANELIGFPVAVVDELYNHNFSDLYKTIMGKK